MRCALQGEQRRIESYNKINSLKEECSILEDNVYSLENEIRSIIERDESKRTNDQEQHKDGLLEDQSKNQTLRDQLERKLMNKKEEVKKEEKKEGG